jgi:hypothetical protein
MSGADRRREVVNATLEALRHTVGRDEHMPHLNRPPGTKPGIAALAGVQFPWTRMESIPVDHFAPLDRGAFFAAWRENLLRPGDVHWRQVGCPALVVARCGRRLPSCP